MAFVAHKSNFEIYKAKGSINVLNTAYKKVFKKLKYLLLFGVICGITLM